MIKYLISAFLGAFILFGVQSAYSLDTTLQKHDEECSELDYNESSATIYDTAFICAATSDTHESFISSRSSRILAVEDLGTDSARAISYSLEIQDGDGQVTAIDLRLFPNWRQADTLEGLTTRGTDTWCEVAKLKQPLIDLPSYDAGI